MKYSLGIVSLLLLLGLNFASAHLMSDQGTNVITSNGSLLDYGNLTVLIYTESSDGVLLFNTTIQNGIVNGSWNLMINPSLEYGISYWKDYEINGENLDFDGNDRIEFQSPLGYINNFSFVNLSLINSCPVGSSIRLVYSNGSVVCQLVSGGNASVDLTNYALKNQSETFNGNITTLDSGFFGFLGSLASRIGKLFVGDIDASGSIVASGNVTADYLLGDGSLLTNLPSAGAESDPIFVAENSTLWDAINLKLAQTDQRYNETNLVISMNTTSNIMSLGFYNASQINSLILGVGNASFNQSLTDVLYYSISNPLGFINDSQASVYNDTSIILTTNSSLWNYLNSNQATWISTFNSTYNILLGQQCSAGYLVNGTLSNGTFTCMQPILSESDPLWSANSTSVLYIANLPLENRTISHISNVTGFYFNYNQTSPAISYVNSQGFLTSSIANASYLMITNLPLENRTKVHCSNITGSISNLCTITTGGSINLFDQVLNISSNVTFESVNATREIYVSNIAVKQWLYNQTSVANSYTDSVNNSLSNWVNNLFVKIADVFNETEIQTQYYNKSDIIGFSYVNSTNLQDYNDTILINSINQTLSSLKLDITDQRYNETLLVLGVNSTTNIMALSFYNRTEINSLLNGVGNASFNQSLTDVLYYSISNPLGFINSTQASVYNDTLLVLNINSTLWSYINLNQQAWNSTFNYTYNSLLGQNCPSGFFVNGTLSNGTLICSSVSSAGSSNIFNQNLNVTSNVTFANITVNSNSVFANNLTASTGFFGFLGSLTSRVTKLFAVDLDVSNNLSVNGNVSAKFYFGSLNYSNFPTTTCSGTDKVIGVNSSGGVVCGTDQTGSGGATVSVKFMNVLAGAVTDTNAPSTERIIGNSQYLVCTNATGYSQYRYGFARSATNGGANAIVYMKYISAPATTITGSSYTNLSTSGLQSLSYTTANRAAISEYFSMDSDLDDICIGAFQVRGDGTLDPQWRNIWIELS